MVELRTHSPEVSGSSLGVALLCKHYCKIENHPHCGKDVLPWKLCTHQELLKRIVANNQKIIKSQILSYFIKVKKDKVGLVTRYLLYISYSTYTCTRYITTVLLHVTYNH